MSITSEGWTIEYGVATRARRGHETVVAVDSDGASVEVDEGRGYLAQRTTTHIPIEVLVELLRGAGWVVAKGETAS